MARRTFAFFFAPIMLLGVLAANPPTPADAATGKQERKTLLRKGKVCKALLSAKQLRKATRGYKTHRIKRGKGCKATRRPGFMTQKIKELTTTFGYGYWSVDNAIIGFRRDDPGHARTTYTRIHTKPRPTREFGLPPGPIPCWTASGVTQKIQQCARSRTDIVTWSTGKGPRSGHYATTYLKKKRVYITTHADTKTKAKKLLKKQKKKKARRVL